MFQKRKSFNPKRRLHPTDTVVQAQKSLLLKIGKLRYTGNPEHKRRPGDFGLDPPSSPRPGKTLCDSVQIFTRSEALRLLREGIDKGTFSEQTRDGWPQNIWAVTQGGYPLEAQLEGQGSYHGYPMPESDPFRDKVLERWAQ